MRLHHFSNDAAQALTVALLQHYIPQDVARILIELSDMRIEQIRDRLLTGAVTIHRDQPMSPFVYGYATTAPAGVSHFTQVQSGTPTLDPGYTIAP